MADDYGRRADKVPILATGLTGLRGQVRTRNLPSVAVTKHDAQSRNITLDTNTRRVYMGYGGKAAGHED
jgi:hypothetical protein